MVAASILLNLLLNSESLRVRLDEDGDLSAYDAVRSPASDPSAAATSRQESRAEH